MYEFELDEPQNASCPCCGSPQTVLVRFVYRDGDAYAMYKAWLSLGSHSRIADVLVVLGSWDDDEAISERAEFRIHLWAAENNWNVSIIDPDFSSSLTGRLGKPLDRENALKHIWIQDVFELSDEIVRHDQPLIDYLVGSQILN